MRPGRAAAPILLLVLIAAAAHAKDPASPPATAAGLDSAAVLDSTIWVPPPWKFGAVIGVNLSQSSFSDNWKGGDRGSFVWVATLAIGLTYRLF